MDWFVYDNGLCHERVHTSNDNFNKNWNYSLVVRMLEFCSSDFMFKIRNCHWYHSRFNQLPRSTKQVPKSPGSLVVESYLSPYSDLAAIEVDESFSREWPQNFFSDNPKTYL